VVEQVEVLAWTAAAQVSLSTMGGRASTTEEAQVAAGTSKAGDPRIGNTTMSRPRPIWGSKVQGEEVADITGAGDSGEAGEVEEVGAGEGAEGEVEEAGEGFETRCHSLDPLDPLDYQIYISKSCSLALPSAPHSPGINVLVALAIRKVRISCKF
jgi:hypothetical protein